MGISFSGGHRPPTHYLFVDGAYLRSAVGRKAKTYFGLETMPFDYVSFFEANRHGFNKIFFYDCMPKRIAGETVEDYEKRVRPDVAHLDGLRGVNSFHVFLGTVSSEGSKARQKCVDVQIAVHMLSHSHRDNIERATLLSGDLDFKPLIDALVQDGIDVTLWYEPGSASQELIFSADTRRQLSIDVLLQHTTPEFRKQHPPPMIVSSPTLGFTATGQKLGAPLREGKLQSGQNVWLYQVENGGGHLIAYPDKLNVAQGNMIQIQHPDVGFLEKFVAERESPVTWTHP